jgi:hypothetical protein
MIAPELIADVEKTLSAGVGGHAQIAQQLRAAFPGVMFSVCSDNDIPSRIRPLTSGAGFALYGIDTASHCATLVSNAESATGLAVALMDEDA